jgi:hypothetical protein
MRREAAIKKLNRTEKLALIGKNHLDTTSSAPLGRAIRDWLHRPDLFSRSAWLELIRAVSPLPFQIASLIVDQTLWGSFWQGDVIAPGYLLPALELAYLRATRIDETFDAPDPQHYLRQLQQQLVEPPVGLWLGEFENNAILVLIYQVEAEWLIIWLTETVILSGYRSPVFNTPAYGLMPLLSPSPNPVSEPISPIEQEQRIEQSQEWQAAWATLTPAARLDRFVQLQRAYSQLQGTAAGHVLADWLANHR